MIKNLKDLQWLSYSEIKKIEKEIENIETKEQVNDMKQDKDKHIDHTKWTNVSKWTRRKLYDMTEKERKKLLSKNKT